METKLQRKCPKDNNLLIVQDLWQTYYQILLRILLKEFIKLNADTNTMIKNVKLAESNKIAIAFLNAQTLRMINRIQMFMLYKNYEKTLRNDLLMRENFPTLISIFSCEKMFVPL